MLQKTRMNRQIGNHKSSLSASGRWNIYLLPTSVKDQIRCLHIFPVV